MNEEDKKAVEFLRENAKDLLTEKYDRDFNLLRWAQVSKYLELFSYIGFLGIRFWLRWITRRITETFEISELLRFG